MTDEDRFKEAKYFASKTHQNKHSTVIIGTPMYMVSHHIILTRSLYGILYKGHK